MKSRIYQGYMMHARLEPVKHRFQYPVYFYAIDLDELTPLDKEIPIFGYNRIRPVSIHDKDYLENKPGTIKDRLMDYLKENENADRIKRIELVTCARYFNHIFNPVSFYYCYGEDERVGCIIAEVNNTFHERHLYILDNLDQSEGIYRSKTVCPKEFYVSPFNDMQGEYHFRFSDIQTRLDIAIDLIKEGKPWMVTRLWGTASPFQTGQLIKTIVRYPLSAVLTLPRISWQAAKLYYQKKLPVIPKPNPSNPMTIGIAPPGLKEKLSMSVISKFLNKIRTGELILQLPDKNIRRYGDSNSSLKSVMILHNHRFFWKTLKNGDIGFGESFVDGDWETDHLTHLFKLFIENMDSLDDRELVWSKIGRAINRIIHLARKNTIPGSRKNIQAHYDLSNEFFQLFLDPTLSYSSGIYRNPEDSLEQSQMNKMHCIIQKAQIRSSDHILEIGSGWGGLAMEIVRQSGCRVTTITLSGKQRELAIKRIRDAGMDKNIEVLLCDYRHVKGQYDKIISVEMLEAVGEEYFGDFFKTCDRLLKPDGLVVLQVITIPDQRYESYRQSTDWIQKYIFPGGLLPSLTVLSKAITNHSEFVIEDLENIGIHYARTLREWRYNFYQNKDKIMKLGFDDRFMRMWEYYLCYCEAGFADRILNNLHLVLTRPKNKILSNGKEFLICP